MFWSTPSEVGRRDNQAPAKRHCGVDVPKLEYAFIIPFEKGWKREIVGRNGGSTRKDVYYRREGVKLRSMEAAKQYIQQHPTCGYTEQNFCFEQKPILPPGTPFEIARDPRPLASFPTSLAKRHATVKNKPQLQRQLKPESKIAPCISSSLAVRKRAIPVFPPQSLTSHTNNLRRIKKRKRNSPPSKEPIAKRKAKSETLAMTSNESRLQEEACRGDEQITSMYEQLISPIGSGKKWTRPLLIKPLDYSTNSQSQAAMRAMCLANAMSWGIVM